MALIETIPVKEDYRRRMAYQLMKEASDTNTPVVHWAQGLAKLAQGALGGYQMYQADQKDKETEAGGFSGLAAALEKYSGGSPATPAMPTPQKPTATPSGPVSSVTPSAGAVPAMLAGDVPSGKVMPKTETNPNGGMYGGLNWRPVDSEPPPETKIAANGPVALPPQPAAPAPQNPQVAQAAPAAPAPTTAQMDAAKARIAQIAAVLRDPSATRQDKLIASKLAEPMLIKMLSGKEDPQYEYKERPDGSLIAVDKKDPNNFRVVPAPGGGQDAIKFEADKAGAIEQAKRVGSVDYEAQKAGAVEKAKALATKEVAKPEQEKQTKQVADIVTQDIDRAIKTMDKAILPTTGATGNVLSMVGGTAAHNLNKLLDTVKANAGFQELAKMRAASPTGGALGSITERELALLQSTIGNLEQSQSEDQLKDNLRRVKNTYLDIVHGPGKGPSREKLTFQEKSGPVTIDGYTIKAR